MFSSKKRPEQSQAIHTLLGKGTLWKGEIQAGQNSLRIEGHLEGKIFSEGEVTIAPTGEVRGTIEAKHLIVTGRITGVFKIKECLEIHGTGYVGGEVEVGSLVVDEGGTLQGNCTRRGVERVELPGEQEKEKENEKGKEKEKEKDRDTTFVPFPTPPGLPPLPSPVGPAAGFGGNANPRSDETATDRHVFNMANGVPPLPPAGEHAYSKTKL
jgi:cytoskeletal protein CcmA (bactofilin family)